MHLPPSGRTCALTNPGCSCGSCHARTHGSRSSLRRRRGCCYLPGTTDSLTVAARRTRTRRCLTSAFHATSSSSSSSSPFVPSTPLPTDTGPMPAPAPALLLATPLLPLPLPLLLLLLRALSAPAALARSADTTTSNTRKPQRMRHQKYKALRQARHGPAVVTSRCGSCGRGPAIR